jgi:hypothetical protein
MPLVNVAKVALEVAFVWIVARKVHEIDHAISLLSQSITKLNARCAMIGH